MLVRLDEVEIVHVVVLDAELLRDFGQDEVFVASSYDGRVILIIAVLLTVLIMLSVK